MDAAGYLPVQAKAYRGRVETVPPGFARGFLSLVVLVAALATAAFVASSPHAAGGADPALTRLLRAMAVIKAAMAAGVIAVVLWRLGVGVKPIVLGGYALVSVAMASGPILIRGMTHLVLGAVLLHAGLAAGALMLWRDPATTARLKALIAARSGRGAELSQAPLRGAGILPALSPGAGRMPALRKKPRRREHELAKRNILV
jgi:hypothetical protein